ncbi:MAG: long-chain acyl-CoA synthetase, partial [Streblomastix strix]
MEGLTVQKLFRDTCEQFADYDRLVWREYISGTTKRGNYVFLKYKETGEVVTYFGSGLRELGLQTQDTMAAACQGLVCVPVYDSYGPAECQMIIAHSEMKVIICSYDVLGFIAEARAAYRLPLLKFVIVIDDPLRTDQSVPSGATHKFSEIVALGRTKPLPDAEITPDMLFTIVYTSGTTGQPKGAMFTHGYFKDEESSKAAIDEDHFFRTGDVGMWVFGVYRNDDDSTFKISLDSLKIIDRRKNIFKLSQCEFICAERVDDVFSEYCPFIKLIMVYEPSTASALVAFTVPDWDLLLDKEREGVEE